MITWILDQHVDRVRNAKTPFIEEARKRNHTVYGLRDSLIPKAIDLTGIEINGPTIVLGSHGFVSYVESNLSAAPGGFLHPINFQLSTYASIIEDHCLNSSFQIIEYENFDSNEDRKNQPPLFVKPLEEMKRFSGVVVNSNQTIEEAHMEKYKKWLRPSNSCKISVSIATKIYEEYRVVVVDKRAITGSKYDMSQTAPSDILEFVDEVAKIWNPSEVYVVDVATTPCGIKIVEYNQFGTAAMYACDQEKIVDAIEKYLLH